MTGFHVMTDLDSVLTSESELVPSSGFAARVMSAVADEAERPPIPFPWKRFATGFLLSILTAVALGFWIMWQPIGPLVNGDASAASAARLVATTAGALLGTFALLRATRIVLRG